MSGSLFIPKMKQWPPKEGGEGMAGEESNFKNDGTATTLQTTSQYGVIALLGLVPIFFIPGLWASLGFDKVMLSILVSTVVVISVMLLAVRKTQGATVLPISLFLFWLLLLTALISGLLSGDSQDALRGSVMEIHTVGFLGVLCLVMTIPLVLQNSKVMSIKALAFFSFSAVLLIVYNLVRLLFGPEILQFGSFGSVTVSPIGGFNDLAIFAGLVIIIGLITLVQLPLKSWLQYSLSLLILASLAVLATINFFDIWLVVGFFSLLMFVYLLSRDSLFRTENNSFVKTNSRVLITTTMLVCIVSAVFIVAGDYAGNKISQWTDVNYVEVKPSAGATIDIAKSVYKENILFGIGPNRFSDAWRQYKDRSINDTIFWDTDFNSGSGFVPTLFVNVGLLGGLLLVAFHLYFLYLGYRMLLRSDRYDSYWYYFGAVTFGASCFIWGMSYIYVPGAGILILGAMFTGMTFVAAGSLLPGMLRTVPLAINRQRGFFLMATTILVITIVVGALFSVTKQYVAETRFSKAQVMAQSIDEFEQLALSSYGMYPDDRFVSVRARIQLSNLNSLLTISQPNEEQQEQFRRVAELALKFAEQAAKDDPTNPTNHAILAGVYSGLAIAGIDGAQERAEQALNQAKKIDPLNPGYRLIGAQMAVRIGDIELARKEIAEALNLKGNFTEALYLSAQLDINEGKTESAIATTRAIIILEPNNPTRYFQLGVLLSAISNNEEAITVFNRAVGLDPAYANARYMLALVYAETDNVAGALEQLRMVQQTNPDNEQLLTLIRQIENGEDIVLPDFGLDVPVAETSPERSFEDTVTTDTGVDTGLVKPINTINASSEPDQSDEGASNEPSEEVVTETPPDATADEGEGSATESESAE